MNTTATNRTARQILQQQFGYADFRPPQEAIIQCAMQGQDSLVLMPTGGGKSLCYQIPALLRPGLGIVVSPLIALMQDQVAALAQSGIRAEFLNSTLSSQQQANIIQRMGQGDIDLLYAAPERLASTETRRFLSTLSLSLIAIDEAHCVSHWGHDFRQDYLTLADFGALFPQVPRMALTATATAETQQEIVDRLQLRKPQCFISSFDRPNIHYRVQPRIDGRRQLLAFLRRHSESAGIVYCLSRRKVEQTANWLCEEGYRALPYHAGMPSELRAEQQRRFLSEEAIIIVATIAFGMGIDKPDVRFVAHLDLPKSLESYYQETGRAGRDGAPAEAFMVYGLQDVVRLQQLAAESQAEQQFKRRDQLRLEALLGWCECTGCRRVPLLDYFGQTHPGDCGNCDNCLEPPATWDATEAARKLLSAVYRSGQRFGAAQIIDILRGQATDKVRQHQHQELSVFGIGKELDKPGWRSLIRQLIVLGFLAADAARYGALVLNASSRPLLRGELPVRVREDAKPLRVEGSASRTNRAATPSLEDSFSDTDRELWDALREERRIIAAEQQVPPYVIFHDATLRQMVSRRPTTADALLAITGVGQAKLERYGETFITLIRYFEAPT